jgi:hypothetical protein
MNRNKQNQHSRSVDNNFNNFNNFNKASTSSNGRDGSRVDMDMTPLKTKQPDTMILGSFPSAKPPQAPGSRAFNFLSRLSTF